MAIHLVIPYLKVKTLFKMSYLLNYTKWHKLFEVVLTAGLLKIGSTGEEVINVQNKLGITPSGIYDAATNLAVRTFQEKNKDAKGEPLVRDGIVGPKTREALFRTPDTTNTVAKEPSTTVNPPASSQLSPIGTGTADVILMGGLDYRSGDYKIDQQVEILNKGTGEGTKIIGHRYTELDKVLNSIAQNPNAKVVLFSAGGSYSKQVATAMQNKSNLYIVEPYAASANTKNSVQAAVAAGVPSKNVVTGSSVGRGKDVVPGATITPSNKGHWGALGYIGEII